MAQFSVDKKKGGSFIFSLPPRYKGESGRETELLNTKEYNGPIHRTHIDPLTLIHPNKCHLSREDSNPWPISPSPPNMELLQGPPLRVQPVTGAGILRIVLEILLILTPHVKSVQFKSGPQLLLSLL